MKKKVKKIIIVLLVLLIIVGACLGGIYAYRKYQRENLQAEVVYVSSLNWGMEEDTMTSAGYVSADYSQNVYAEDKTVAEVKVTEGTQVKIGDPLLVFDTTDTQLQIDMKELEIQGIKNDITLAQRELDRLNKVTPVPDPVNDDSSDNTDTADTEEDTEEEQNTNATVVMMEVAQQDGDAYNYINKKSKPYTGKGSADEPYRFLCTKECYVTGTYLNYLVKKEKVAAFEIWTGNSLEDGTLVTCWTVDGSEISTVEDDSKWLVATQEQLEEEEFVSEEEPESESEEPESEEPESTEEEYTVSELKEAKQDKESDLKELELDRKKAEIELQKLKKKIDEATVLATIDGVVKTVGDPQNPPTDGSAFIEVTGSSGLYVKGEVSELMLDQIKVGQEITANSWSNGQVYTAKITEISEYPSESSGGYYGDGNPNVSYYSFMAYIENSDGLLNGDYVDLSMTPVSAEDSKDSLYIEKAYVREENGQSYVFKVGEDDRLVKQYVKTGKTLYGSAIEIKAGLSGDDRVAFPYGKTAKEGIKAVDSEEIY